MEAGDRTIEKWMHAIDNGRLQLPRFQRFEAWGGGQVSELLETVLDGLPAGAVLILRVEGASPFKARPLETAPGGPDAMSELLLDGQQRLTALWRALNDTYEDLAFFVRLEPNESDLGGHEVEQLHRYVKDGKAYPLWANNPEQVLARGLVPVKLCRPGNVGQQDAIQWIHQAAGGDSDKEIRLILKVNDLRTRVATFNLPFLFLPPETTKPIVLQVFVKMNTMQAPLTAFDIITANVEGELGESLHDKVHALRGHVPRVNRYVDPADLTLNALALLQDRAPNQTGYFGIDWTTTADLWSRIAMGAEETVNLLEQERVFDAARLPTILPVPVMTALFAQAASSPDALGNVRSLLRRYMWCSFFTARYERAAATAALQDYRALLPAVQIGRKDGSAPIFEQPLPTDSDLLGVGWPKKRDRLARALLLVSFKGGALDLADEAPITAANIGKREYHHLFPVKVLQGSTTTPDLAINCALITWKTNRTISADHPIEYLKERAEQATLGQQALLHRLSSHAIPFSPLAAEDYEAFLLKRAELLASGMRELCAGRPWSPFDSPLIT